MLMANGNYRNKKKVGRYLSSFNYKKEIDRKDSRERFCMPTCWL